VELEQLKINNNDKLRIIQEIVPGKQITLAHIIAAPDECLYRKLGLDPKVDYSNASIGILTVSPAETAVIAADIAMKTSNIDLGFVDRFSGTVIITGKVSDTETAIAAIVEYAKNKLDFSVCGVTRT
jgi:ethanolamine utilization protein EutS